LFAVIATVHSESSGGKAAPEGELKELAILRLKEKQWAIEKKIYELKIDKLQRIIWGNKSERLVPDKKQTALFEEPASETATADVPAKELSTTTPSTGKRKAWVKKGPKLLDPNLPREVTQVPGPDLKELICPVTGKLMQPAFTEQIEVLARRAPEYYVKVFERCVFVSPAKTAPVYAPWPSDILPRARVHASIVAHISDFITTKTMCHHVQVERLQKIQTERG
jgi:hypothetical protein